MPLGFLALLLVASAAPAAPGRPAPPARPRLAVVSPLVKVRPGAALPVGSTASLSAARGECEGTQVVVLPPAHEVTAKLSPLTLGKARLEARLYRESFIEIATPSNSRGAAGPWPDPLIPVTDAYRSEGRSALPFDSTGRAPLVLYVEVCVPAGALPGRYTGVLTLHERGEPLGEASLEVTVQPFTLPATSSLPNTFGLSLYSMAKGHGVDPESSDGRRLLMDYARSLLAHRVSPHGLSYEPPPVKWNGAQPSVDFTAYDEELGPLLSGTALASGARLTTTDLRGHKSATTPALKAAYYRAMAEHLRARGWEGQLFFYAKDEPKRRDYPLVQSQAKAVRDAQAEIPVLITSPPTPELNPSADILCPVLNCFFPRPGEATCPRPAQPLASMRSQLRPRAKVWWYQSCMSHGCDGGPIAVPQLEEAFTDWASYMVDHSSPTNRAMGPLAFVTGVDGELYFDTVYGYTQGDVWKSVFHFGGNGDGTLFYPGTPARVGGSSHVPIESLRLKTIRDGLEDFEYLTLLARSGDRALAMELARELAPSGYRIEQSPERWQQVRARMTARLAELALREGAAR